LAPLGDAGPVAAFLRACCERVADAVCARPALAAGLSQCLIRTDRRFASYALIEFGPNQLGMIGVIACRRMLRRSGLSI